MNTNPFKSLEEARRIINGYCRSLQNPHLYVQRDPEDITMVLRTALATLEAWATELDHWRAEHEDYKLEVAAEAIKLGIENTELKAALEESPCRQDARVNPKAQHLLYGNWVANRFSNKPCGQCAPCKARAAQAKAVESIGVEEVCRVLRGGQINSPPSVKTTSGTGDDR